MAVSIRLATSNTVTLNSYLICLFNPILSFFSIDVEGIIKRKHQFGKTYLKVFPFYNSLGTALYGKERPILNVSKCMRNTRKNYQPLPRPIYQIQTSDGIDLAVSKADLCSYAVDAVVINSNKNLKLDGGTGEAIVAAAGSSLQEECDKIHLRRGQLKPGDSVITGAGGRNMLFHAVVPPWDNKGNAYKVTHLLLLYFQIYFDTEAIVNAANENLQHYGGLALALCEAGGPDIQSDSDKYIKRNGALKTGDAVIGNPGCLPCQKIIHAEPDLRKTVNTILARAEENKFKSVAIPALSSGLFNFPVDKCADIIVDTVRKNIENRNRVYPRNIALVNNDERTVKEMERACRQAFGRTNAPVTPKYGEGIYFSGSVRGAVDLWREQSHQDVYQYYVEAKVLTGKSTPGKRDLIMPPPVGDDPLVRFDSLSGGTDISVIFNGHQAHMFSLTFTIT
uniref:Macro domain-containing protein n=1 Tax=Gadus morhua TaxID=8049 RepID=A0A8C5BZX9_GADMO